MKNVLLLLAAISLCCCNSTTSKSSQDATTAEKTELDSSVDTKSSNHLSSQYIGKINDNIEVIFLLTSMENKITGSYYYSKQGVDIPLEGEWLNDSLKLFELDCMGNKTASINGLLKDDKIVGNWKSLKTGKSLNLSLLSTQQKMPLLPPNIEGVYHNTEETNCNIDLSITKKDCNYVYILKVGKDKFEGKVSFSRNIEEMKVYINFEGIKIDGLLEDSEITIQNTGNSMNYYVKFEDCDEKYIHLSK